MTLKIAIYRSDKDELRVKISQLLREDIYGDAQAASAARQHSSPYHLWAEDTARKIVSLLEEEGVWDHVVED